jgi:acetolactate synthase regulatory subunit
MSNDLEAPFTEKEIEGVVKKYPMSNLLDLMALTMNSLKNVDLLSEQMSKLWSVIFMKEGYLWKVLMPLILC